MAAAHHKFESGGGGKKNKTTKEKKITNDMQSRRLKSAPTGLALARGLVMF